MRKFIRYFWLEILAVLTGCAIAFSVPYYLNSPPPPVMVNIQVEAKVVEVEGVRFVVFASPTGQLTAARLD